jgi:phage repressor protein C with HTH and peptisase S24 domain
MQDKNYKNRKFLQLVDAHKARGRLTDAHVAKTLKITPTYISKVRGGWVSVSERLLASAEFLLDPDTPKPIPSGPPARQVPVVSWAKAGIGADYEDLCRQLEEWVETDSKDPGSYGVIIEGDSMEPDIRAGDTVVFAPNSAPPYSGAESPATECAAST